MADQGRRCFLACFPDHAGQSALASLQTRFEPVLAASRIRWLPSERCHVTLVFLGDIDTTGIRSLVEILRADFARFKPITCHTQGGLFLPSAREPRVFAVGVASDGALEQCAETAARHAAAVGLPQGRRRFKAHLTLARVAAGPARLESPVPAPASLRLARLGLYQSHLEPAGARYVPLWEAAAG